MLGSLHSGPGGHNDAEDKPSRTLAANASGSMERHRSLDIRDTIGCLPAVWCDDISREAVSKVARRSRRRRLRRRGRRSRPAWSPLFAQLKRPRLSPDLRSSQTRPYDRCLDSRSAARAIRRDRMCGVWGRCRKPAGRAMRTIARPPVASGATEAGPLRSGFDRHAVMPKSRRGFASA